MKKVTDKAESRGRSSYDWLDSRHTFSFDKYYNPRRMNFGALRVLNDDRIAPGKGFGTHPHKNMEIISIPLKGKLKHGDSIYIENLPKDITWSVEETPAEGYTAYTEYGVLNKTQGTSYNGTTNGQEITAAFTNVKDGEIDTGVILDNAPYILMLAVVAGGAMTLVIKKRREEE